MIVTRYRALVVSVVVCANILVNAYGNPEPQRELNGYEIAGPYILAHETATLEDILVMRASARDFLWRHWRGHRRGVLTTVSFTTEGLPIRTTDFVEPDEHGKWKIVSETQRSVLGTKTNSPDSAKQVETSTAYSVERVEPLPDGTASDKPIPDNKSRDPMSYRLVLKDRAGKIVDEL
jgi:hypothetical protein